MKNTKPTITRPEKTTATSKAAPTPKPSSPVPWHKYLDYIFLGIIMVILLIQLKPVVIDGLVPRGVDVVAGIAETKQISEYQKSSGEIALWNPYIFGGMPIYQRQGPTTPSVDTLLGWLSRFANEVFIYYLFAALGMFLLVRYLKMSSLAAFLAALAFVLMPHYTALWMEGHYAKFRALMYLPWILLTFLLFLKRRDFLAAALFALAFGNQIRTQHYQIIFYTGLMIFAVGIGPFVRWLIFDKDYMGFLKGTGLLALSVVLALMLAAQPMFLADEYLPYSKRGKTTVSLDNPSQNLSEKSDGVTMEYATQWSTAPKELLGWAVPRIYGGMSGETYHGKKFPHLEGKQVPGYWGDMPFTQSYEYMGVVLLIFAMAGLALFRKNRLIRSLSIFGLFLVVLSFGSHLQWFYALFYDHFPYFSKFRAPMMSVTINFFIVILLAAFGVQQIQENLGKQEGKGVHRRFTYIFGAFAALGLLLWMFWPSSSFVKAGENYDAQQLEIVTQIRQEFFTSDLIRYFFLVVAAWIATELGLRKIISFSILGLLLAGLVIFDLATIQARSDKEFVDLEQLREIQKTPTDEFLLSDKDVFRILPVGQSFQENRWAYYHQTIGGYSPIKMYTMEELIENSLYKGPDPSFPVNWNMLKFLNVKYVILDGMYMHPELELVHQDQPGNRYTFLLKGHKGRAFFAGGYEVITDEIQRLRRINDAAFNADSVVILEENPATAFSKPDSSWVKVENPAPGLLNLEVYTDRTSLLVISEMHYPPGWQIKLDGQPVDKVYRTDHTVQSIIVPEGKHSVTVEFHPPSYYKNMTYARISGGILLLLILISLIKPARAWMEARRQ